MEIRETQNSQNNLGGKKRAKLENSHFPSSKLTIKYNTLDSMVLDRHIDQWCEVGTQIHSFACGYPEVSVLFVEITILYSSNCLGTLSKVI